MEQSAIALSTEQQRLVARLTQNDKEEIDKYLLQEAAHNWRKVARIMGFAMPKLPSRVQGIPDVYYLARVKLLVQRGLLEIQGDLNLMRHSEVRFPQSQNED